MAATQPGKVLLRGEPFGFEREAAGVITPGHLITLGSGNTVVVHASAGAFHHGWIAVENALAGDDLDHNYASGEVVQIHHIRPGDVFFGIAVAANSIVIGDRLESNGNGEVKEVLGDSAAITEGSTVGIALTVSGTLDRLQVLAI